MTVAIPAPVPAPAAPTGTAGTPPPRQFRSIDDVANLLRADFATNGIAAVVEASEWNPVWHAGEPRVVVGYDGFTFGPPMGSDQPGPSITVPDGTGDVARAILDDLNRFRVWVHHNGSGASGEPAAERARASTKALLLDTIRAIREGLTAPFREPPSGHWPKPTEQPPGYPAFVYGSFVEFSVLIPSPVLGGRLHVGNVAEIIFQDSINIGGVVSPDGGGQAEAA